jgi:hypothetical protein
VTEYFETEPVPPRGDAAGTRPRGVDRSDVDLLLAILKRIMTAVRCEVPAAANGEALRRWEDDDHVYFEAELPDNRINADINIHDRTLMIRLEKAAGLPGPARAVGVERESPTYFPVDVTGPAARVNPAATRAG